MRAAMGAGTRLHVVATARIMTILTVTSTREQTHDDKNDDHDDHDSDERFDLHGWSFLAFYCRLFNFLAYFTESPSKIQRERFEPCYFPI